MIDDDDNYQLDDCGNRVLIGLTAEETAEFVGLDTSVAAARSRPGLACDEWTNAEDYRWLELYEKHEAARLPFRAASRTIH